MHLNYTKKSFTSLWISSVTLKEQDVLWELLSSLVLLWICTYKCPSSGGDRLRFQPGNMFSHFQSVMWKVSWSIIPRYLSRLEILFQFGAFFRPKAYFQDYCGQKMAYPILTYSRGVGGIWRCSANAHRSLVSALQYKNLYSGLHIIP